jgi:hypothetical protein
MIGPTWATVGQPEGAPGTGRRLDDPRDLVRAEIRTAVDRGLDIIPVLVGGAAMPRPDQLPDELKALAARNACELSDRGVKRRLPTRRRNWPCVFRTPLCGHPVRLISAALREPPRSAGSIRCRNRGRTLRGRREIARILFLPCTFDSSVFLGP